LAAYGHQDLPFERLVEVLNPPRSLSRHPLFQVMLAFEGGSGAVPALDGVAVAVQPLASVSAKFDLSVALSEGAAVTGGEAAGVAGVIEYASDLFDRGTVERLAGRL